MLYTCHVLVHESVLLMCTFETNNNEARQPNFLFIYNMYVLVYTAPAPVPALYEYVTYTAAVIRSSTYASTYDRRKDWTRTKYFPKGGMQQACACLPLKVSSAVKKDERQADKEASVHDLGCVLRPS